MHSIRSKFLGLWPISEVQKGILSNGITQYSKFKFDNNLFGESIYCNFIILLFILNNKYLKIILPGLLLFIIL